MHLVIAYSILILLLAGTYAIWRASQRRAANARIEPMQPTMLEPHRSSPQQLRASVLEFCAAHPGLKVEDTHGNILVTWKLPPERGSIPVDVPIDRTWSVELRITPPDTVRVRYGECWMHWSHVESQKPDEPSLHRIYDWRWNMNANFETPGPVGEESIVVPEDKPYTNEGLVIPLQRLVLANGWAWQPTLDVEEGAESEAIAETPATSRSTA